MLASKFRCVLRNASISKSFTKLAPNTQFKASVPIRMISLSSLCNNSASPPVDVVVGVEKKEKGKSSAKETEVFDELAMSPRVKKILDELLECNMLEICELSKALTDKFDLPDHFGAGMTGGMAGGQSAVVEEAPVEEKTAFDVKLKGFDPKNKIKVIKEVRAITGLGLKEAKELVEKAPSVLKKDIKKEEAEAIMAKLKEVGGEVEMD